MEPNTWRHVLYTLLHNTSVLCQSYNQHNRAPPYRYGPLHWRSLLIPTSCPLPQTICTNQAGWRLSSALPEPEESSQNSPFVFAPTVHSVLRRISDRPLTSCNHLHSK